MMFRFFFFFCASAGGKGSGELGDPEDALPGLRDPLRGGHDGLEARHHAERRHTGACVVYFAAAVAATYIHTYRLCFAGVCHATFGDLFFVVYTTRRMTRLLNFPLSVSLPPSLCLSADHDGVLFNTHQPTRWTTTCLARYL